MAQPAQDFECVLRTGCLFHALAIADTRSTKRIKLTFSNRGIRWRGLSVCNTTMVNVHFLRDALERARDDADERVEIEVHCDSLCKVLQCLHITHADALHVRICAHNHTLQLSVMRPERDATMFLRCLQAPEKSPLPEDEAEWNWTYAVVVRVKGKAFHEMLKHVETVRNAVAFSVRQAAERKHYLVAETPIDPELAYAKFELSATLIQCEDGAGCDATFNIERLLTITRGYECCPWITLHLDECRPLRIKWDMRPTAVKMSFLAPQCK